MKSKKREIRGNGIRQTVGICALACLNACSSLSQTSDEVLVREPGHRLYGDPKSVAVEAVKHWEFAILSDAAYRAFLEQAKQAPSAADRTKADEARRADEATEVDACKSPETILSTAGWSRWSDFPSANIRDDLRKSNLRVEVWQRDNPAAIVVAFGGTVFLSGKDWASNLRWFIPFHDDEYTQVIKRVGPDFVAHLRALVSTSGGEKFARAPIYSTGHSLGAGLAQEFAYALPVDSPMIQRVKHVYAFDPSPVTGYSSVDSDVRKINVRGLQIDRIFERGEILASVRSIIALVDPPSVDDPTIRTVRYDFDGLQNPISAHALGPFACHLYALRDARPASTGMNTISLMPSVSGTTTSQGQ
jgi:pimeloyl-ACP methyl ester carboxylesterase